MFKIIDKIKFPPNKNRMRILTNTSEAISHFNSSKSKNLKFLLKQRFDWMNKFIDENDIGLEVGSGAGFSKFFIKNKNLKTSDFSNDSHLDCKNIDAQNTNFNDNTFDYVIASNMIHHVPYPIKLFKEMNRILKKDGKLIIFDAYCSILLQLVMILMKHEGFDFTVNVWDEKNPKSDELDVWDGNIGVTNLIFDNKLEFDKNLGNIFSIEYEKLTECFIFLNSGGVTSQTFHIPLSDSLLNILNCIDNFLVRFFPNIFCMGRRIVLKKKN